MPTFAGQMTQTPPGNPQWRACNGSYLHGYKPPTPPQTNRPHAGTSTGGYGDYLRNVGGFAGRRGIGAHRLRLPYDKSGTWYISTADDNSETSIPGAPTPQHPPPGVV